MQPKTLVHLASGLLGSVVLFCAVPASATLTLVSDRLTWESVVSGTRTDVGFEGIAVDGTEFPIPGNAYQTLFSAGPPVTFVTFAGSNGNLSAYGTGFSGATSGWLVVTGDPTAGTGPSITVALPVNTTAIAFDFGSALDGESITVVTGSGSESLVSPVLPAMSFFGVTADVEFSSLTITLNLNPLNPGGGTPILAIDNFAFTAPVGTAPGPAPVWLMLPFIALIARWNHKRM